MKWVVLWAASTGAISIGAVDSTNPWAGFAQLGAAGVLSAVLWAQLGKAEKRADEAVARALAAYQETVPVLALATERLSEKVAEPKITSDDVRLLQVMEQIEQRLRGGK